MIHRNVLIRKRSSINGYLPDYKGNSVSGTMRNTGRMDHAIVILASQYGSDVDLPRDIVGDVTDSFSYVMGGFSSHFNS